MSHLHDLSEQIFEIRGKCTDEEYKNLMDSLKKLYDEQQKKPQSRLELELDDLGELEPLDDGEQQNVPQPQPQPQPQIIHLRTSTRVFHNHNHNPNQIRSEFCSFCYGLIKHIGYRCINCPNYNLCDSCNLYNKVNRENRLHDENHTFTRIESLEQSGWVKVITQPKTNDCCTIM